MANIKGNRSKRFVSTLILVVIISALLGFTVKQFIGYQADSIPAPKTVEELGSTPNAPDPQEENLAWQYAKALQQGNMDWVVDHTLWMQERLQHVKLQNNDEQAVANARQALRQRLSLRKAANNQLKPTGIADQYIFAPSTTLEFLGMDTGHTGLAEPTALRTWIHVTYTERNKALRDTANIPIRSIIVGINVSHDNKILKANIVGNLDITTDSITYEW